MTLLLKTLNFYINSSLHVAIAASCFCIINYLLEGLEPNYCLIAFVFLATFSGYNFLKYYSNFLNFKNEKSSIKIIGLLSLLGVSLAIIQFFRFKIPTQISIFFTFLILLFYAFPFSKHKGRNQLFLKTHWVTLAWTIICTITPILESNFNFTTQNFIYSCQFYLHIFTTMLVFEIIDLKNDDEALQTIPQVIGIQKTKILGFLIILINVLLMIVLSKTLLQVSMNFIVPILFNIVFLGLVSKNSSRYFSQLWCEAIPIFWLLTILAFAKW